MSWDASKPPASGYLQSAEIRANLAAIELQVLGVNLFGDPEYRIWAEGDAKPPSWWNRSVTTLAIERVTSIVGLTCAIQQVRGGQGQVVKISHGGATATLSQNVLSTGDMNANNRMALQKVGHSVGVGAWVYTNSADCKLYVDLGSCTVLSSAIDTAAWTWKTMDATLTSDMTCLGGGVQLDAAGTAYVGQPTMLLGPIAPKGPVPCPVSRGTVGTVLSGNPVIVSTNFLGVDDKFRYLHNLPWIIERCDIECLSAITSGSLVIRGQHTSGSSVVESFATSTRPSVANGASRGSALSGGKYQGKCFAAKTSGADVTDALFSLTVGTAATGGGKNPTIMLRTMTYQPPLLSWRLHNNYK